MSAKTPVWGSICLVAGTTIGAGMLALPLTISAIGLIPGIVAIIVTWFLMYVAGLFGVELNLRCKQGLSLGGLGKYYSGTLAQWIGDTALLILTYSLMTAYLFGGASIFKNLLGDSLPVSPMVIMTLLVVGSLLGPIKAVDYSNRLFFILMLIFLALLMVLPLIELTQTSFSLPPSEGWSFHSWQKALPVLFTSFGFHIIQNSLALYCEFDSKALKKAFFWGSLIPLLAYILWIVVTLLTIHIKMPHLYHTLYTQKMELGNFIQLLTQGLHSPLLGILSWSVAILAIITSAIGVGLAMVTYWNQKIRDFKGKRLAVLLLIIPPSLLIGTYLPEAFVGALGLAGLILTVIALFMPLYLLKKSKGHTKNRIYFSWTNSSAMSLFLLTGGILIVVLELSNLLSHLS